MNLTLNDQSVLEFNVSCVKESRKWCRKLLNSLRPLSARQIIFGLQVSDSHKEMQHEILSSSAMSVRTINHINPSRNPHQRYVCSVDLTLAQSLHSATAPQAQRHTYRSTSPAAYLRFHKPNGIPTVPQAQRHTYRSTSPAAYLPFHKPSGIPTAPQAQRHTYLSTSPAAYLPFHKPSDIPTAPQAQRHTYRSTSPAAYLPLHKPHTVTLSHCHIVTLSLCHICTVVSMH